MERRKTELQQKLESERIQATWSMLVPHLARGALLLVDPELPLVLVAMAVAADDTAAVTGWLASGQLERASPERTADWDLDGAFEALIVQPYVLASPRGSAA